MELNMRNAPSPLRPTLFETLRRDPEVLTLIEKSDGVLRTMGYTDHGRRHVTLVAVNAAKLLSDLGHDAHACDLAAVAGLLHDIGNCAGRTNHASVGAAMAFELLRARGVSPSDAADVMSAIGNHDEAEGGVPVNVVGAALVIADKADIHRSRVRTQKREDFDIHDKVNYSVTKAELQLHAQASRIGLRLTVDSTVVQPEELADLFGLRFAMSDAAARFLGQTYGVEVNGLAIRIA
jgi:metal-dependent HD superfamily phosphatase/phosphodiesterase